MIARIWHGRTNKAKADEYLDFLKRRALPDYRSTPGNLAAYILRRAEGDVTHFLTITHWESLRPQGTRCGINMRNFDPAQLGAVRIRRLDGASSWKFLD